MRLRKAGSSAWQGWACHSGLRSASLGSAGVAFSMMESISFHWSAAVHHAAGSGALWGSGPEGGALGWRGAEGDEYMVGQARRTSRQRPPSPARSPHSAGASGANPLACGRCGAQALRMLQAQGHDGDRSTVLIVGDRYDTDVRAGVRAGLRTCLVESGCHSAALQRFFPRDRVDYARAPC